MGIYVVRSSECGGCVGHIKNCPWKQLGLRQLGITFGHDHQNLVAGGCSQQKAEYVWGDNLVWGAGCENFQLARLIFLCLNVWGVEAIVNFLAYFARHVRLINLLLQGIVHTVDHLVSSCSPRVLYPSKTCIKRLCDDFRHCPIDWSHRNENYIGTGGIVGTGFPTVDVSSRQNVLLDCSARGQAFDVSISWICAVAIGDQEGNPGSFVKCLSSKVSCIFRRWVPHCIVSWSVWTLWVVPWR